MMQNLIFNVLMALVVAIAGIVAKQVIPFVKAKKEEALAKIRQTKWAFAADIIDAVVRAVEQTVSDEIHGEGKKELAIKYIQELLAQNGIEVTAEQLDALIEAAVQAMNDGQIKVEVPESIEE